MQIYTVKKCLISCFHVLSLDLPLVAEKDSPVEIRYQEKTHRPEKDHKHLYNTICRYTLSNEIRLLNKGTCINKCATKETISHCENIAMNKFEQS